MAIFRTGHVVGAISGNLGAANFVQGKYGPYVRKRLTRTKRYTERQLTARRRFKALRNYWLALTDEQRLTWDTTAAGARPINRLGLPRKMTGFELYFRANLPMVHTPWMPTFDVPPGATPTSPVFNLTFAVTLPNNYIITWDDDLPVGWGFHLIHSARPVVGHVIAIKSWRHTLTATLPGYTKNLKNEFVAQWGAPATGEYVTILFRIWGGPNLRSKAVLAGCIVT